MLLIPAPFNGGPTWLNGSEHLTILLSIKFRYPLRWTSERSFATQQQTGGQYGTIPPKLSLVYFRHSYLLKMIWTCAPTKSNQISWNSKCHCTEKVFNKNAPAVVEPNFDDAKHKAHRYWRIWLLNQDMPSYLEYQNASALYRRQITSRKPRVLPTKPGKPQPNDAWTSYRTTCEKKESRGSATLMDDNSHMISEERKKIELVSFKVIPWRAS